VSTDSKKQKIVIGSTCHYKGKLLEQGVGYEMSVAEVRELRGAGRVARILGEKESLPKKPSTKS